MASEEYIQAAKQANRQPTTYMSVESADGQQLYYTTQAQWQGSDTLTNIDTAEEVGSVINERFYPAATNGGSSIGYGGALLFYEYAYYSEAYKQAPYRFKGLAVWPISAGDTVIVRFRIRDALVSPTIDYYTTSSNLTKSGFDTASGLNIVSNLTADDGPSLQTGELFNVSDTVYISGEYYNGSTWETLYISRGFDTEIASVVKETAQVITTDIDFGVITTFSPIFGVNDITETGALIAYSYSYSDLGVTYTSGGTIVDGDTLTPSRYYKIQADFTTTTGGRSKIREIQLKEGIFRYFGSHIDTPFAGVSPQIIPNSVSTLSQKIQIGKGLATTGETSVRMFWVSEVSDMIASGYLKGKDVAIYSGFVGLATSAYEPILVGTWYDHDLDEVNRVITVKIRDVFKQFEKRKIPEEVIDTTDGSIDTVALAYTPQSLVTVMKDIFDNIGLRDRYISDDFDTLEVGDYSAAKYKVSRTITKPQDFNKLLDELAVTGSMYLVPLGNGQIKPKPFNINQEHKAILDAKEIDFTNLKGNIKDFYSRFYAYYNPITSLGLKDPSDDRDDYDNGTALIDANAEVNWFPERGTKNHYDKWKAGRTSASTALTSPPQALTDLMILWNALFTEPLYTLTAKKVPPRYADIEPSDVIQIDNLDLPVVENAWDIAEAYTEGDRVIHDGRMWRARQDSTGDNPTSEAAFWQDTEILENGLTEGKHFFVLGRKFNPNTAQMELELMEMPPGTLGAFSADEFSSAFDIG